MKNLNLVLSICFLLTFFSVSQAQNFEIVPTGVSLAQEESDDAMLESEDEAEDEDSEDESTSNTSSAETAPTPPAESASGTEDKAKRSPELRETDWNKNAKPNAPGSKVPKFKKAAVPKAAAVPAPAAKPAAPIATVKAGGVKLTGKFMMSQSACEMYADEEFKTLAQPAGKVGVGKRLWTESKDGQAWVKIKRTNGDAFVKRECFK